MSPAKWGGSLADAGGSGGGAVVLRYAESFGIAENFAEYCGILVLLCLGLCLFEPSRAKAILYALEAAASVTGVFTGTRSFVLGVARRVDSTSRGPAPLGTAGHPTVATHWGDGARRHHHPVAGAGQHTAGFLSRFQDSEFAGHAIPALSTVCPCSRHGSASRTRCPARLRHRHVQCRPDWLPRNVDRMAAFALLLGVADLWLFGLGERGASS